jgi:hypothetical protein
MASAFNESSVLYAAFAKMENQVVNVCNNSVNVCNDAVNVCNNAVNVENYAMKEDNSSGNDARLISAGIEAYNENAVRKGLYPAVYYFRRIPDLHSREVEIHPWQSQGEAHPWQRTTFTSLGRRCA